MLLRAAGAHAVLLEVDDLDQVAAWRGAVAALVAAGRLGAPVEVVPGARTLLLDGVDPVLARRTLALVGSPEATADERQPSVVEVPVVYDGADLAEVAGFWGVSEREVVAQHTGTEFTVAFCGFAPGFPYLVGLGRQVPRRQTPRPSVPAGSVGLAGRYCGIYPSSSPGGWQLLGTTSAPLFDVRRDPPSLLPPGARVRFVERTGHAVPAAPGSPAQAATHNGADETVRGSPALTVLRAGALTTVQDCGRRGSAHLGVPRAGAMDLPAARCANRLVGNPGDAALLETTLDGVALRAATSVTIAVTGAQAPVTVDGRSVGWGVAVGVRAGSVLEVGSPAVGVRSYLAVGGGIAVEAVLGSRATDTLAGLGPAPLRAGDVLPLGTAGSLPPAVEFTVPAAASEPVTLRMRPGPRDDWFGEPGLAALAAATYTVSALSNRVGIRLSGPALPRRAEGELESEGIVLGSVQVPPDGRPVVLAADHPTTGGYPVIGVVDERDLAALAQSRPGRAVRFRLTEGQ